MYKHSREAYEWRGRCVPKPEGRLTARWLGGLGLGLGLGGLGRLGLGLGLGGLGRLGLGLEFGGLMPTSDRGTGTCALETASTRGVVEVVRQPGANDGVVVAHT